METLSPGRDALLHMSAEKDITLDEKRVYGEQSGATSVFVAAAAGLARVEVSDDIVGEFGLAHRGEVTDVATNDGRLAVATPEDVLVGTGDGFAETGFGPATAVGFGDGLLAAGEGRIARYVADADLSAPADRWETVAEYADVRALSGDLAATAEGIVRLGEGHVGLSDARDVTTDGDLLAATADGLFYLANGWMEALDGGFRAVAADGRHPSDGNRAPDGERAAAVADDSTLYLRKGEWTAVETPDDGLVDVALAGEVVYAVTEDGTLLVDAGEGWRSRALGLPDARRLAVA